MRKNEFGDSEVVLRWSGGTLLVWRQPFSSVSHEGLPISFPGLPLSSWLPLGESGSLPSLGVRPCPWHMQCTPPPCGHLCHKSHIGCSHGGVSFPLVLAYHLDCEFYHWHGWVVALLLRLVSSEQVLLLICCLLTWLVSAPPVFPNRGYQNVAWCVPVPRVSWVSLVGLGGL